MHRPASCFRIPDRLRSLIDRCLRRFEFLALVDDGARLRQLAPQLVGTRIDFRFSCRLLPPAQKTEERKGAE